MISLYPIWMEPKHTRGSYPVDQKKKPIRVSLNDEVMFGEKANIEIKLKKIDNLN